MRESRGTKHRSNEERRAQIIDAALSVFAKRGFLGSRTREIAEQAGISEALIFQYFKNKEDLYRIAIAELIDLHPIEPEVKETMANEDDYGVFRSFALHIVGHCRQDPRLIRLLLHHALDGDSVNGTFPSSKEQQLSDIFSRYIQQRIEEGVFGKANAWIVGRLFCDAIFMYFVDQEAEISGPSLPFTDEEAIDTVVKIFLAGLNVDTMRDLPIKADISGAGRPN